MLKKARGFTLIELLIVVAIIGILAALLIPNAITAIQKSKQKATMKDIVTVATGATDFVTDHGTWTSEGIAKAGDIATSDAFVTALSPFYVKVIPINDQWGNPFEVYLGAAAGIRGIPAADLGEDDFVILSWGRGADNAGDGVDFDPSDPTSGMYEISSMADFANDLINWSGSWIRAPRSAVQ